MKYALEQIASLCGGIFSGHDCTIEQVLTDSRTLSNPAITLFVALRGLNHDGHRYIGELYEKGVRAFLIDDAMLEQQKYPEAGFILHTDAIRGLHQLASYHRSQFKGTVVAITGSNGKTVTKEWIAQLCPTGTTLFRSPKSYNSQIGVPLSLLMLANEKIAIIEAGISQTGEMQRLEAVIRPHIGIFTNLGEAHQENFGTRKEKLMEKLVLFQHADTIIHNNANPLVNHTIDELFPDTQRLSVGVATYDLSSLPFQDSASLENAATAIALYGALGFPAESMLPRLGSLQRVAMRLELKEGVGGSKIINDSYNSDINSLAIALDYLASVGAAEQQVVILSDIFQSGLPTDELYAKVAQLIAEKQVNYLIGIGPEVAQHAALFHCHKEFYERTEDLMKNLRREKFANRCILLKGSRSFGFERISRMLEKRLHTTVLEVNLDAMIHNLNYFRAKLNGNTKVMAMVKALGYGSGTFEVANMLEHQGVNFLAVAFADEGVTLREAGITMPIVVLNADSDSFEVMIDYHLEPEIYSFTSLQAFRDAARSRGESRYPIHIKLDTGMHRLGFEEHQISELIALLENRTSLAVSTIFSHLAVADEPTEDAFTRLQIERFDRMSSQICTALPNQSILRHLSNSAGIERFPEARFDMVRLGIGLYGISVEHQQHLQAVSSLKSRIVQIKELRAGETVGYGRHGKINSTTRIATVPMGYADGLNRQLSRGRWSFRVQGHPAPIVGNICMDTCMIDISGINTFEGDAVTIFGPENSVIEMASLLNTIPYEVMTSISTRVKRIYTKE